ncbi:sugar nucleotide-binding protein, partial [Poseidonibacter sp.]|uniref:sugar nucleotide-binding protein n=1 Tax=Poseidonibacter sp. TaxID=2321188 RepID=UPI003C73BABD
MSNINNSNLNELNILVTGSKGQVGSELRELSNDYDYNFFFTTREDLDITNSEDIKSFCKTNN